MTPSNSYAVAFDEVDLASFLNYRVWLDDVQTAKILAELGSVGHANIGDVDIPKNETSSIGFEQLPNDV